MQVLNKRGAMALPHPLPAMTDRPAEPRRGTEGGGLTPEEIRQIVLELLG